MTVELRLEVARRCVAVALPLLAACGPKELPPPLPPSIVAPAIAYRPTAPVRDGAARVVLDADGGPAEVLRVTETYDHEIERREVYGPQRSASEFSDIRALETRRLVPFCVTPCVGELSLGAHHLVFTRQEGSEEPRMSTAKIAVSDGETWVVRHALGRERPVWKVGYTLSIAGVIFGTGLMLIGGLAMAMGAVIKPGVEDPNGGKGFTIFGAVVGGTGLALDLVSIIGLVTQQPEKQQGSTTQFPLPRLGEAAPRP